MTARTRARGFTLIELMIVVSIIGILAAIAIPEFGRLSLRSRTTERREMMGGIARAFSDFAMRSGTNPDLTGEWNPALPLSTGKRVFDSTMAGWKSLPLEVDGSTYYSYRFVGLAQGVDPDTGSRVPTLFVYAQGDLDGDGAVSSKSILYIGFGNSYALKVEDPLEGQEDQGTF